MKDNLKDKDNDDISILNYDIVILNYDTIIIQNDDIVMPDSTVPEVTYCHISDF